MSDSCLATVVLLIEKTKARHGAQLGPQNLRPALVLQSHGWIIDGTAVPKDEWVEAETRNAMPKDAPGEWVHPQLSPFRSAFSSDDGEPALHLIGVTIRSPAGLFMQLSTWRMLVSAVDAFSMATPTVKAD